MKLIGLNSLSAKRRRVTRGFTLVELVVVLIIISILAAVGTATAIGYIKQSKFNKNEQNAITIYQTSQTAMSQMISAGTMDKWIRDIIADDTIDHITALAPIADPEANETVGKTVYLTYNPQIPNSESRVVYDLLSKYFYDQTIFSGTISIEFYMSMTYDANKVPYYSARVLSAFFSNENKATVGWDDTCLNGSTDNLPDRDPDNRYNITHVGYYDGTEASAKPQVVSVFLPRSQMYIMDGHIIGPIDDPNATASNYLFNIRNGETLDISWALFDEDGQLHTDHGEDLTIKLVTPNDGKHGNSDDFSDVEIKVTSADIKNVKFNNDGTKVIESIGNYIIERESASGLITLNVKAAGESKQLTFPITRTVISGDGRTGCPKDPNVGTGETPAKYYEYRLSIDCMMVRSDESQSEANRYNIKRLFGDTPRNFYATLEGSFKVYKFGSDTPTELGIPLTYAARAIDDPVFFVEVGKTQSGQTAYFYKVDSTLAAYDVDDEIDSDTGEFITGTCFVNTLFGDYKYSNNYKGTSWSTAGGDAVITAFRHLYNIRNVNSAYISNFRIVRDLDWYVDKSGLRYVSDVRIFTYNNTGNGKAIFSMPASNSVTTNAVYTVPFPAFSTLSSNQSLEAMTGRNGTIYSINNLQLRKSSFIVASNSGDSGYGLICENFGKIGNLRTNNLSLVMADVADNKDDYSSICPTSISVSSQSGGSGNLPSFDNTPIGGLVGINSGEIGNQNSTIVMSNSIVMANKYWTLFGDANKTATGGIIGVNENTVSGSVEINGSFAVVGRDNVGGLIGKSTGDIEAKLLVNSSNSPAGRYKLPSYSNSGFTTQQLSCIIICKNNGGGAVGLLDGAALLYSVDDPFTYSQNPENGVFSEISDDNYQIDVNLPDNSLIVEVGGYNATDVSEYNSAGGAIGYMRDCGGDTASIRVYNSGSIIVYDTSNHYYCGGAIGRDYNCSTQNVYINVNNGSGRLGYINDSKAPVASGGAIGQINSTVVGRTIVINVVNNGTIVARGNNNGQGAGGAIGGAESGTNIKFLINAVNNGNSSIKGIGKTQDTGNGVGGAIGGIGNSGSQFPSGSVIYSENYGSINGASHVGGAVGFAPLNKGKIYSDNYGTITGSNDYVGGAVGRLSFDHYGTIQAVLESSSIISGSRYIGGAAGRLTHFQDGATVRTIVNDSSSVIGTGSLVGGICGDIRLDGTGSDATIELIGNSSEPVLTVNGNDGVGGAIGVLRSENVIGAEIVTPDQGSTNKLVVRVKGNNYIGGVVGTLKVSDNDAESPDVSNLLNNNSVLLKDIMVTISIKLNPKSFVEGSGNNVGGAVGYIVGKFDNGNYSKFGGIIDVSTAAGSTSDSAYIRGNKFVGGAVGRFENLVPALSNNSADGYIKADFSAASWDIEATVAADNEADVGGAVGYFQGATDKKYGVNGNAYPILVNLGSTNVESAGYNVGGAIGRNQVRNGIISVSGISGTVSGQYNVGGAIGYNQYHFNEANVTVASTGIIEATGYSSASYITGRTPDGSKGDGSNVGGAIGNYSFSGNDTATITAKISATISGNITGPGNNVGGAVGYCYSSKNRHLIRSVTAVLQGNATVCGIDNVGGAIGFSLSNITNVKSDISGTSSVEGNYHVGGAIGWTYAVEQQGGANVLSQNPENLNPDTLTIVELETKLNATLYKTSGRIANIVATISADYALQGIASIGGAVGQSGYKAPIGKDNNTYASPALINVKAIINTGYLFDPFETGIDLDELNPIDKFKETVQGAYGNACIGGAIGLVVDGRINSVELGGTGGTVNTDSRYPCPEISMSGAVLMAAKGNSIGGIIGQIGLLGYGKDVGQADVGAQNVTVSKISASDSLGICVVSLNDANNIGGWIGSGYGVYGGIGNRLYSDYKNTNARAIYNVNNIRYIYSKGSNIGGFCGYSRGYKKNGNADNNSSQPGLATWADINVVLKDTTICGSTAVGGAFGRVEGVKFAWGCINVELKDHSVIGDPSGSHICEDAGGAIGYLRNETVSFGIPVTVTIDSTSRIWADGGTEESPNTYGVGGSVGRCSGVFARLKYNNGDNNVKNFYDCAGTLTVISENSTNVSVYSRSSNAGGVVGVMDNVNMSGYQFDAATNYYSYASGVAVQADGDNACVGGYVGRINSLSADMINCYSYGTGTVYANGTTACAGGFVGYATLGENNRKIDSCYTTSEVKSSAGEYTGGFVGRMLRGTVSNSYVGGHTYQGSYVSGEGNVSGKGNVGGFVGATTGANNVTFDNCYSTASVLGTTGNIGGFIGNASTNTIVTNCYCTGRVICPNTLTSGAFAGNIGNASPNSYTGNKVMRKVNVGNFPLLGESCASASAILAENIDYADNIDIRGTHSDNAYPFDLSLPATYDLRAVIGSVHYGDWPLPSTGTTIENAEVQIYAQTGKDEQGNPQYEWVVFENNKYEYPFNGTAVTIDPANLKLLIQGVPLEYNKDYVIYYRENSKVGTATITFAAKSGSTYSGAISKTFKIIEADIEGITAEFNETSREYSGARIIPDVTVTYNGVKLVYGTDYTLAYDRDGDIEEGFDNDNISIGTMSVYVIGKGNYTGTKLIGQFEITTIDLSKLDESKDIDLVGADNLAYDEEEGVPVKHCPDVVVKYNGNPLNGTTDPEALGFDYVISYEDNDKAGTAYLVITGTADESIGTGEVYTGVKKVPFTISPAVNTWIEEPAIDGWVYGETPNAPTGSVKFGEIDYIFYSDANCQNQISDISTANAGKYYVQVFAKENSNYTGPTPVILSFTILPVNISEASVSVEPSEYLYTGSPIDIDKSNISVTVGEGESAYALEQDDFTIASYDPSEHTEPGIVTITVAGTGNYEGTASGTFTIYREYEVKFISNGQIIKTEKVRDGYPVSEPDQPEAETGYKFGGWYTDSTYSTEYEFSEPVIDDLEIHAKWIRVNYITYITGDPDVVMEKNPQEVEHGTYADRPADPVRNGYVFEGWYDDNGNKYEFNTKVYGDITLTANWIPEYTVAFYTGEGSEIASQTILEDGVVTEPAVPPEWEGHKFGGWYTDKECTSLYDFAEPVKNSFTLYAKWISEYTVTFFTGEGSVIASQTVLEDGVVTEPADPPKWEGHKFIGWYKDKDCTIPYVFADPVKDDFTLYAKWEDDSGGG